jgi:heat shock protein HtpX
MINQIKTTVLLCTLSALLLWAGHSIAGTSGLYFAFIFSLLMNFVTYFFSDKIVLRLYNAQPLDATKHRYIVDIVEELAHNMHMPMPKLWYIPSEMANAFATGRNPAHASVAVTQGILNILDKDELRGVLAHELSHVKNRDILVGTIAATLATAIGYLASMLRWSFIFGDSRDRDRNGGGIGAIFIAILMPIAAALIQLAISRSREYLADETGAHCCHDPLALASALEKLGEHAKREHREPENTAQATSASLFIVYPFTAARLMNLFSTHPPMEERIKRLRKMATKF